MTQRMEKSLDLYKKASDIIPGGSQMFNKRPSIYHPARYPIFAKKAEGAYLYDVDGKKYIDYLLGYGTILLGYNYPSVREAVIKQIRKGTVHSVNDPLEIELAEELVGTIPSAEMVRYFLSGSEATSAAVRIARAYTGRSKIIKWGYHGWHDWCITVNNGPPKNMLDYLEILDCPFDSISHVPQEIAQHTLELRYNDIASLRNLMKKEGRNVACIIMEPFYFETPQEGFLEGVREIVHEYRSLFILDEVKTGARIAPGGAQEYFNIIPDISVFGKAISNGYPFSLVAGKKDIMNVCERLWFSGTNSGNTIGISAALATIRESKRIDATNYLWKLGEHFTNELQCLIESLHIEGEIGGLPPMPYFTFTGDRRRKKEMTDIFLSEMISKGIFLPKEHCLFISYSHTKEDIDRTLEGIEDAFSKLKKLI